MLMMLVMLVLLVMMLHVMLMLMVRLMLQVGDALQKVNTDDALQLAYAVDVLQSVLFSMRRNETSSATLMSIFSLSTEN